MNLVKNFHKLTFYKQNFNFDIEVDGGINFDTAPKAISAGADVLVAGTATFNGGPQKYASNISKLRNG